MTKDNFEEIVDLDVLADQADYVASNVYSIAEASFHANYVTRAIYFGDQVVGFLMYVVAGVGEYAIWRFMVDHRYQRRGIGRQALSALIGELRGRGCVRRLTISYHPENSAARHLYFSCGFAEIGLDDDGEMLAEICWPDLATPRVEHAPGASDPT